MQIKEFKVVVQLLIKVAIAQAAAVMAVTLLIKAGDDISAGILKLASDQDMKNLAAALVPIIKVGPAGGPAFVPNIGADILAAAAGILIFGIIALLASALLACLLLIRVILLAIALVFLPVLAASVAFETGNSAGLRDGIEISHDEIERLSDAIYAQIHRELANFVNQKHPYPLERLFSFIKWRFYHAR
ncbi:hypothetical protein KRX53_03045 [Dermabacteraceae bacterium TAE3-ERU5]|nr:hypothetical protein [Dermabacteraceae bacterium TAE3-ERU5]